MTGRGDPPTLADAPLSPALLERALEAAGEGIVIADARLPDTPLIYVNPAFEAVTGYPRAEVLGRNCRFLQGAGTEPAAVEEIRRALAARRGVVVEILNYRRNGTPFWNRLSITPVYGQAGEVTHFIGVQSDVTARRLAEDRLAAANLRMSRDLHAAARLQASLLPKALPEMAGLAAAWTFRPCQELAGDMLNVFPLGDGQAAFFVLDVSGHGVAAALLSFTLAHTLAPLPGQSPLWERKGEGWAVASPARVAAELNRRFQLDPAAPQYFTLCLGIWDPHTGRVRVTCAGHPLAVLAPAVGEARRLLATGPPIGVSETAQFGEEVLELAVGDRLLVCTDGLPEALSPAEEELGMGRVLRAVEEGRRRPLVQLVEALADEAVRWAGGTLQDDVSVLGLERTGGEG